MEGPRRASLGGASSTSPPPARILGVAASQSGPVGANRGLLGPKGPPKTKQIQVPFFEPDPLERVSGLSSAGNRPKPKIKIIMFITDFKRR